MNDSHKTPKRPPCEACGDDELIRKRRAAARAAQAGGGERSTVPALDPSSLPTCEQIAEWLGPFWEIREHNWSPHNKRARRTASAPPHPWWLTSDGRGAWVHRCYLLHKPTGQRVEVTAPRLPAPWSIWLRYIRDNFEADPDSRYSKHVRWLDPDTKTSTGSEGRLNTGDKHANRSDERPAEALEHQRQDARSHRDSGDSAGDDRGHERGAEVPMPVAGDNEARGSGAVGGGGSLRGVVPTRCSSCNQPFWAGRPPCFYDTLCGDCFRAGTTESADHLTNDLDTRIAEVAEPEVRIEDMPGAWMSPSWEDVS